MMSHYVKCSAIKLRGGTVVLYPLAKYQPEVKPLHRKRVQVIITAEEWRQGIQTNTKTESVANGVD